MFKLVLTFEGKVRGYWRGKPALSLTLLQSYRGRTSGSRVRGLGSQSLLNMKEQTQSFLRQLHSLLGLSPLPFNPKF